MINAFIAGFILVSVLLALFDFYYARKSFRQKEKFSKYLGYCGLCSGVVCLAYLASILTTNYLLASIMASIYFACIDWLLICLLHFVYQYTGMHENKVTKVLCKLAMFTALIDTILFIINIFKEISVSYVPRDLIIAHYGYVMKPPYIIHLIFNYILVLITIIVIAYKSVHTPKKYRNQYILIILAIAIVIAINAVFLYPDANTIFTKVDYSIPGYSIALVLIYWSAFTYRGNYMMKSLSQTIFENINQGIVLFDYANKLIMHNDKANALLNSLSLQDAMDRDEFLVSCNLPLESVQKDQFTLQCDTKDGQPLRCDFRTLKDEKDRMIGSLFVFTDATNDIDLVTGFEYAFKFRRFAAENPYHFGNPTTAVVFDILGLGDINRTYGREVADQRIRSLAKIIRNNMPQDSYFIRGFEAHLVVVCNHYTEKEIVSNVEEIISQCGNTVMYGMCSTSDGMETDELSKIQLPKTRNVIQAIETASSVMQQKKLLNTKSSHSQTLSSLVRALEEADSDTEAHVQRTQLMGKVLADKLGFSDMQKAELDLLCILHDIGKIGIPLEILNKPGKLTDTEWAVLRSHAEKGYQIAMSSEELKPIAKMILHHHERWDGNGYPERLSSINIPILSRVITIIDAYDAMVNNRSYRKALAPETAQEEIRRCAGKQFDPYLADEFLEMLAENPDIAVGKQIGGEEVRVFLEQAMDSPESGNTYPIQFSRYLLDLDDGIIEVDDQFETLTGYSRSEVIGRMNQSELIPSEDRSYYLMQVNNQFSKSSIAYLKHEIQKKDGSRVKVICCGKRYYDSACKDFRSELLVYAV